MHIFQTYFQIKPAEDFLQLPLYTYKKNKLRPWQPCFYTHQNKFQNV